MNISLHNIPLKRILVIASLTLVGTLMLLLVGLAFLPLAVSSSSVQNKIRQTLSTALKRQVIWSDLSLGWSKGLTLTNLTLGTGPAPLLKTDIELLVIVPSLGWGRDDRFGIDLVMKIRAMHVDLAPGPAQPPPPSTKDPLTQIAEAVQRIQGLDFPLPLDVRLQLEAAPLQITYHTPSPGKALMLQDFSLRVAMPSLASKPVNAELSGLLLVDGRPGGKVQMNARVSDLVTQSRRIRFAPAIFAVDASAPGAHLSLNGGLSQPEGFSAQGTFKLPELLTMVHPFLAASTPNMTGSVELKLQAKTDAKRDLHAALSVTGSSLGASGGSLKTGKVGPLDLTLQQEISTDHTRQRVNLSGGLLAVPGLIDGTWSATVDRPTAPARTLDLQIGPVRLELAHTAAVAAPFVAADSLVRTLTGEATLRSLRLKLAGPENNGTAAVSGFGVKLPRFRMAQKGGEFSAEDVELLLEKFDCRLVAKQPVTLAADLRVGMRTVVRSGASPFSLRGGRGRISLTSTDLNLKSASPRKFSAAVEVTQWLDLDYVSFGGGYVLEKAHEQLRLKGRATEQGDIEGSLPEFSVQAAALQIIQNGKKVAPLPLSASLTAEGMRFPVAVAENTTLRRAVANISSGDILQFNADAALSGTVPQRLSSSGKTRVDLQRAMAFVPTAMKATGKAQLVWDLAMPLQQSVAVADAYPLRSIRAKLSRFDKLDVGLKLENVSTTVASSKGDIHLSGLRTTPELRVTVTKKGESARFDGGLHVAEMRGLPGAAGKLPLQHGSVVMNGELTGWRELHLSEELHIDPLAFSHEGEVNVSRIDGLLEEKQPFSTATMVKRLDATLFATVDARFSRELKQLLPGVLVAGDMSTSARLDLSAGRELALRYSMKSNDFDLQFANGTKIEGLRSDITVQRVYGLAAASAEKWTPLSAALVRPVAVVAPNPGAAVIVGRINDDLRGAVRGARSLSIRRVTTQTSKGVPLVITALEGDLLFGQEKAGLSFFQADLLGGTVLARSLFDLRPEIPTIGAASSFSNLDVTRLVPQDTRGRGDNSDAEVTGELNLTAPLTAEQRELFEKLRLSLNIRKIGANTIERALFALDPYERNEQLVAQRKMLKMGGLQGIRITVVDGAGNMEGEAQIKGVAVALPNVDRLRISELPQRQELAQNRGTITALRGYLDLLRADTLVVGSKGELTLKRRNYEK